MLAGNTAYFPGSSYVAVGHSITPFISTYAWSDATGFGTKFADPATLPTSYAAGVSFNPTNTAISLALDASPYVHLYPWSASGFGTKYANPATLPTASGISTTWSANGNDVFYAAQSTPYIFAYPFSAGYGTKYANPATLPTGTGFGISYNTVANVIGINHATTPFISTYPWSSGFGTKYANPATLPAAAGRGLNFSPNGSYVANAYANSTAPSYFGIVYPWSSGFGTAYAQTLSQIGGEGSVAFNPTSDALIYAGNGSVGGSAQYLDGFAWSASGYGTRYANPASLPSGTISYGQAINFSKSGKAFAIGVNATPFVEAYPFNKTTGYGTKYSNPATLPTGTGRGISFSN
jgi:hypothetical protein